MNVSIHLVLAGGEALAELQRAFCEEAGRMGRLPRPVHRTSPSKAGRHVQVPPGGDLLFGPGRRNRCLDPPHRQGCGHRGRGPARQRRPGRRGDPGRGHRLPRLRRSAAAADRDAPRQTHQALRGGRPQPHARRAQRPTAAKPSSRDRASSELRRRSAACWTRSAAWRPCRARC